MNDPVTRRAFVTSMGMAMAVAPGVLAQEKNRDKREALLSLRKGGSGPDYVPAAFFVHFDRNFHFGRAAVEKHLEYFRFTGMDFLKVQYERTFPSQPDIRKADDWQTMPHLGRDFFKPQLEAVEGLVKAVKREALVLVTLYSPFMCAGHATSRALLVEHLNENAGAVRKGLEIVTQSLLLFVRECRKLGVDGFYASTQGGESGTFRDKRTFEEHVRPFDLILQKEIDETCAFNILHVCDYEAPYADLTPLLEYPGHVVSCSSRLTGGEVSMAELARRFQRPVMGGLDRKGVLSTGTNDEVASAAQETLEAAPDRFILGADCTVPGENRWEAIRTAISAAHAHRKG